MTSAFVHSPSTIDRGPVCIYDRDCVRRDADVFLMAVFLETWIKSAPE